MKLVDLYYEMPYWIRYPVFVAAGAMQARARYGPPFQSLYQELIKNLSMSEDKVRSMQDRLLRKLLLHAYEHVPYYRRVFRQVGFHPEDYREREDLACLPVLTKEEVKHSFADLIADNTRAKDRIAHRTGGTTGDPAVFLLPRTLKGPFNYASLYRFYSWAGVRPGDRRVSIAGRLTTKKPPYAMCNPAENQLYICAHHLRHDTIDDIVASIIEFRPLFVQGHPSAVTVLCRRMAERGIVFPAKSVFTTSEQLYPDQRALIEQVFDCKVFDTYGMGEMVAMASECSMHQGYHIAPEYGVVEVINEASYESGVGELVCTSLQNYVMPLIRYHTGDLGKASDRPCPCGCRFPMLESISGRVDDLITDSNGRQVLPLAIRIAMRDAGLTDYQLIQKRQGEYVLRLLGGGSDERSNARSRTALRVLRNVLGDQSTIHVELNANPIRTRSGKQQMVVRQA